MLLELLKEKNKNYILMCCDDRGNRFGITTDETNLKIKDEPAFMQLKNESVEIRFTGHFKDGEPEFEETKYDCDLYIPKYLVQRILDFSKNNTNELIKQVIIKL